MKKLIFPLTALVLLFSFSKQARAVEEMVFDSTGNYLGGCQLTDKSEWELKTDLNISKFQIWYKWSQGETSLPVNVFYGDELFAKFTATRAQCDPYQSQWCNADFVINKLFPKGKYSTKIEKANQCLKPNATGTVRLYSETGPVITVSPTVPVEQVPSSVVQPTVPQSKVIVNNPPVNSCTAGIILTAVITFLITGGLSFLIFRRKI